tara:strand:- start:85 stop:429 length:345 start_codon:yes stop_codon:yes gene_type:complete
MRLVFPHRQSVRRARPRRLLHRVHRVAKRPAGVLRRRGRARLARREFEGARGLSISLGFASAMTVSAKDRTGVTFDNGVVVVVVEEKLPRGQHVLPADGFAKVGNAGGFGFGVE